MHTFPFYFSLHLLNLHNYSDTSHLIFFCPFCKWLFRRPNGALIASILRYMAKYFIFVALSMSSRRDVTNYLTFAMTKAMCQQEKSQKLLHQTENCINLSIPWCMFMPVNSNCWLNMHISFQILRFACHLMKSKKFHSKFNFLDWYTRITNITPIGFIMYRKWKKFQKWATNVKIWHN